MSMIKPKEMAKRLGITVKGILKAYRTPTNRRMTHIASKGLHRSLFGLFRQVLTYKANWYGNEIVLADCYYPSTQRCSKCGHVKTGEDKIGLEGNLKHGTKHYEYICYECGFEMDRDENAVVNLLALIS